MSVFTSEPPVWNPTTPPASAPTIPNDEDHSDSDCVIRETSLLPASFEVFAGKIVDVPWRSLPARSLGGSTDTVVQRLSQLKIETETLLEDLKTVDGGDGNVYRRVRSAVAREMMNETVRIPVGAAIRHF